MAELNIYQKLAKIRKQVEVVQKNKSGYGYKYVTDDELLAKITGLMDKYGVSLIPSISRETTTVEPYSYTKTKKGVDEQVNEVLVYGDMQYAWINNDTPDERVVVDWFFVGHQSDGSQSFGSALTYSMRYFLLKYFNVATPESDPDNWRSKQREAEVAEDKAVAEGIVSQMNDMVREYINADKSRGEVVKKFFLNYVKDGDYFKVKESRLAAKMMEDFTNTFINKGE